ncbi:HECT-type E3 ubiquitin transferase [Malassezia caprae]|uniref:HECT-type E3 ubiquitin transferase n=1 Tax=Malassezia caprae TaxID=1381934 RepID=A0AAF0EA77_9BASI|nr:HECT-type E3 ubiquitin transferase [Malassezia caprae]
MKITKAPKRKPEVPADLASLGARMVEAPEPELAALLASVDQWVWPRGDLYSWVAVLNRLDDILARICTETPMRPFQTAPFAPADRALLLAILHFSRLLLENCMNRKLYASYEHLDTLLGSDDAEVLEALLYLLLRPAQQHAGSGRHELAVDHARLAVLASAWPPRDHGIELADAAQEAAPYPAGLHSVQVHCHQRASAEAAGPATPVRHGHDEPSDWVYVHHLDTDARSPGAIVQAADRGGRLSDEERFELFHKVRVALAYRAWPSRQQAIVCRLLAIACFAHIAQESAVNTRLFMVEPSLVLRTAALLEPVRCTGYWVQSAALYALDSVGHFRVRLGELLTAVNASVSHGLLLQVLLNTHDALQGMADGPTPPLHTHMDAFVDALMTLVANLTTTVSGSTMVVSAGLIPQLLELACIVSHTNALVQRTSARAIGLLDSLLYSYQPAFEQFTAARGMDVLVARTVQCVDDGVSGSAPLAFGATNVLRQLLRLFHHLMTTTGLADGLRNLIDTPLVPALRTIMEHPGLFGTSVLAQAVTIMASFVHNEPTQLVTIQEHKLPEAFLSVVQGDLEPSFELLNAFTTAIGALCLNETGLHQMTSQPIVPRVLRALTDARYHRVLLDRDNANIFGTAVDELVRHHPSLKEGVQSELVRLLEGLVASGHAFHLPTEPAARALYELPSGEAVSPQALSTAELVLEEPDQTVPEPVPGDVNSPVASFDVVCRFLEGFFRNAALCRDFMRSGSLARLLAFLSTPCIPYHFGTSSPADSLVMLLRTMVEESPSTVLSALLRDVHKSTNELAPPMLTLLDPQTPDIQPRFRAWVRLHTHLHVLTDVCETFVQSFMFPNASTKVPLALFRALSEGGDVATLLQLGELLRVCVWEHLSVKAALRGRDLSSHAGATAVQYMGVRMQASLLAFFSVVARLLTPKRHMDAEFAPVSAATTDQMARALRAWETKRTDASPSDTLGEHTYLYLMHTHLLYDRRPTHGLHAHSMLLHAWVEHGGDAALGAQLHELLPQLEHDGASDPTSVGAHAVCALRAYLDLYARLLQARPLLDAPQTTHLARDAPSVPHKLLVDLRARALDVLEPLWQAPWLAKLPLSPVRMVGQALGLILHADRETLPPPRPEPPVPTDLSSALAATLGGAPIPFPPRAMGLDGPSRTVADETRLGQLLEMGFPRGAARRALERCHNNVSAATEYILQHPELEDEPDEPPAPQGEEPEAPQAGASEPNSVGEALAQAVLSLNGESAAPEAPANASPETASELQQALLSAKSALDERRTAFRPTFFPRLLELADTHEPLVFDAKQVMGAISKDKDRLSALWEHILQRLPSDVADPTLPTRLHFVALLLTYERVQLLLPWSTLPPLAERLLGWAQVQAQSPTELPYYASVLMALNGVLGLAEAPYDEPCDTVLPEGHLTLLRESRAQLLPLLLQTLERAPSFSVSALLATYRVLVLVTRDPAAAASLAEGQQLATVLRPMLSTRFSQLASCQRLVLMILRHVVETGETLVSLFAHEIHAWFAHTSRTRHMEITHLLKAMSYAVLRDPVTYMRAASTQLELVDGPGGRTLSHVRLQPNAKVPAPPDVAQSLCDAVMDALLVQVLQVLQGELGPLPGEATPGALSEADARDAYAFFLLQAMVELTSSYMGCKHSFRQYRVGSEPLLAHMLTTWVPSGFLHNYEPEELRKRMAQSNWAMSLGVALAMDPMPVADATSVPDGLVAVRKALLDALHKALRDAQQSTEAVEVRYGRLYALADLCHRLLTAQPHPNGVVSKRSEVVLHLAKTMLEKNFVPLLASVLADVDLGFPSVRALLEAVLRPLEHLTRASIKMARAHRHRRPADGAGGAPTGAVDPRGSSDDDDEDDDDDEMQSDSLEEDGEGAPDFYRNSSLGMHTGEMEHGTYDSADELSDEEDDAEMEMEEYDSEEGSELSTDAEGLDGDSTHVVEVMEEDDSMDEHDEGSDDVYDELEDEWEDEYDDGLNELNDEDVDYVIEDDRPVDNDGRGDEHGVDEILEALDDMEGGDVDLLEGDEAMESGDEALLEADDAAELDFGDDAVWPTPRHTDDRFGANWTWTQPARTGRRGATGPPTFFTESLTPRAASEPAVRPSPSPARLHDDDAAFHPLLSDEHAAGEGDEAPWSRSVEALMGGPTMQFLEMFLQRNVPSGADASIRIELDHGHGTPRMHIANMHGDSIRPQRPPPHSHENPSGSADVVAESHRFTPLHTSARRGEEALVLLGTAASELGAALRTQLAHALQPQQERREPDTAQRAASDAKRKRAEMDPASPEAPPSRGTASLHEAPIDLTGTGIDPTFLEALPEELREEALLSQQLSARIARSERRPPMAPDFLDVLPRSLRAELQHVDDEAPQDRPRASGAAPLPPHDHTHGEAADRERPADAEAPNAEAQPRNAIQLLDRAGMAALVRLLYFPSMNARPSLLHKVLAHLSENTRSRTELLTLLLLVLSDSTTSSGTVDRSFAAMSNKASRQTPQRGTPRRPASPSASGVLPPALPAPLALMGGEAPHLIASRSLETLTYLTQANDQVALHFLREDKTRKGTKRMPVQILLSLLEKDTLLEHASLVNALVQLLNMITKLLVSSHEAPDGKSAVLDGPHAGVEVAPIPAERLAALVRPLKTPMSSRAFQHTLGIASNLAHLPGARDVISEALQQAATRASQALITDLDALIETLPPVETGDESAPTETTPNPTVPPPPPAGPRTATSLPLAKLASPTSAQAEFLRCLRALDYLYVGK